MNVYVIYTGGTVGMKRVDGVYTPVPGYLAEQVRGQLEHPDLPDFDLNEYTPLLDSANMRPVNWQLIAEDISDHYDAFEGFVVLHGTDTMAYTAAALSFMLEGLGKPVILTGSQIPLAEARSDARENLITSLLLAAHSRVPEVCLYLNGHLLRGNRATKVSSSGFEAFTSPNFPPLGSVGVEIEVNRRLLRSPGDVLKVQTLGNVQVIALRLFPGITAEILQNVLLEPVQGLVLETYGAGNAPSNDTALLEVLHAATARGVVVVNCTQCLHGSVDMSDYATGSALRDAGVVGGFDMTPEAALTKLVYLLSKNLTPVEVRRQVQQDLRGELTRG